MCIRDRDRCGGDAATAIEVLARGADGVEACAPLDPDGAAPVSYTHLRAHETVLDLVCRLLLEKNKQKIVGNRTPRR